VKSDTIYIGEHSFPTLVAITTDEQAKGLMHKQWPPPVMAFPYARAGVRKFWMKNTISPLDIIFCRDNKIVDICYGEPLSLAEVGPNELCDLVVEFPHGTVKQCGFRIGDTIKMSCSDKTIYGMCLR